MRLGALTGDNGCKGSFFTKMNNIMKKLLIECLLLLAVLIACPCAGAAGFDINTDGNVDSLDYRLLSERILDKNAAYEARFDIDGNGTVDAVDLNRLIREMNRVLVVPVRDGVVIRMIMVESGTFILGATKEQGADATTDEVAHNVTLTKDYRIAETVVTEQLWSAVMDTTAAPVASLKPKVRITWHDCKAFVTELNKRTGLTFRLPTEAEWEFAARGGRLGRGYHYNPKDTASWGYKYAGSDNVDEVAWHRWNSDLEAHTVALKKPNELGLYDMNGNVYEWCEDWFALFTTAAATNPKGPATGVGRVIRGGSYTTEQNYCRVTSRSGYQPGSCVSTLGFRLAMDAK